MSRIALGLIALVAGAAALAKREAEQRGSVGSLDDLLRRGRRSQSRRKPPGAGLPMPAVPPKGPLPLQGGAEAPLDFSE